MKDNRAHQISAGLVAVAVTLGLGGCDRAPTNIYRYRMTVNVTTPQGQRSGSSVIEVKTVASNGLQGGVVQSRIRGEAVMVELPNGKSLFALLDKSIEAAPGTLLRYSGLKPATGKQYVESLEYMKVKGGQSDVPQTLEERRGAQGVPTLWPTFVYFDNINQPMSVHEIEPQDLNQLGKGFALKSIHIALTDDEPTNTISKKLPWLSKFHGVMLDGSRINDGSSAANSISSELLSSGER